MVVVASGDASSAAARAPIGERKGRSRETSTVLPNPPGSRRWCGLGAGRDVCWEGSTW